MSVMIMKDVKVNTYTDCAQVSCIKKDSHKKVGYIHDFVAITCKNRSPTVRKLVVGSV